MTSELAIGGLIRQLDINVDEELRCSAAYMLGELGDPAAFDALAKVALEGTGSPARESAAVAIGKLGHPLVESTLWRIVSVGTECGDRVAIPVEARGAALAALRRRIGLLDLPELERRPLRLSVIDWVNAIGSTLDPRAVAVLAGIFVRGEIAFQLWSDDSSDEYAEYDDDGVMVATCVWLGKIGGTEAAKVLSEALNNESSLVVDAASKALVSVGAASAEFILPMLDEDDVILGRQAALILAKAGIEYPRVIPFLGEWLRKRGDNAPLDALLALGVRGFVEAAEAAFQYDFIMPGLAERVLAAKDTFFPILLRFLDEDDEAAIVPDVCAKILGRSKDPAVLPLLIQALAGKKPGVSKVSAALALGDFGGPEAVAALRTALRSDDDILRQVVREVLAQLKPTGAKS